MQLGIPQDHVPYGGVTNQDLIDIGMQQYINIFNKMLYSEVTNQDLIDIGMQLQNAARR